MRRKLAGLSVAALLVLSGAAACPVVTAGDPYEVERCDRDDHPNEPECRNQRRPSAKPSTAKPAPAKPAPTKTK